MKEYDLIIVGTGPAGLSAAIYAARYMMNALVIGQLPGGTASYAHKICNYPGFKEITGMELMMKILEQTKDLKVPLKDETVVEISKKGKNFEIKTNKETYIGKKLLLATGTQRRELGIEREKEFVGKGISYCATCDAGFYKNKIAAVVGGGDAALTAALLLGKFAKKVYIIYRQESFTKAEKAWVEEIKKSENIEPIFNSEVVELMGEQKLEKIKLNSNKEIKLDGLFIEIGGMPNTKLAEELNLELKNGSIIVDKNQKTNVDGVFAAGDVTDRPFKQIITAAGDGATACYIAYKELEKEKSNK